MVHTQTPLSAADSPSRSVPVVRWIVFAFLVFLRFGVADVGRIIFPALEGTLMFWYELATYALTLLLIWLERTRLSDFNIDGLAIILIVLAKPAETLVLPLTSLQAIPDNRAFPMPASLFILGCSLTLLVALLVRGRQCFRFTRRAVIWWLAGMAGGVLLCLLMLLPNALQVKYYYDRFAGFGFWRSVRAVLIDLVNQFGYAPINEEPLFRAFLWGYLLKAGIPAWATWLLVALSFVLAHAYDLNTYPISMFVTIPVGALALGMVAWKSKTIAASIGMHGMYNGLGLTSLSLLRKLELKGWTW